MTLTCVNFPTHSFYHGARAAGCGGGDDRLDALDCPPLTLLAAASTVCATPRMAPELLVCGTGD